MFSLGTYNNNPRQLGRHRVLTRRLADSLLNFRALLNAMVE